MIPPPAMTTSALCTELRKLGLATRLDHAPHLKDHLEGGEDRDLAAVVRRRDLDDVEADELRSGRRPSKQLQRLPARQPARGRDLGPRRECWVENIDVEGDVDLLACQPVGNP